MNLVQTGQNTTEISTEDTTILFSYNTPVAAKLTSPKLIKQFGGADIKTRKQWSVTTSKHITQFFGRRLDVIEVDQRTIDSLFIIGG